MSATRPEWLKKRISLNNNNISEIKQLLEDLKLNTVCQSAKCPNIFECFSKKTATFMLMGNICTRNCAFCGVASGKPEALDSSEPLNVAKAATSLNLKYIVLTSVTRDDLPDGGTRHFYDTVMSIHKFLPQSKIECLIPDFKGSITGLEHLLLSKPDVLNHNIETINKNYGLIRKHADYKRSLDVLKNTKKINNSIITKSGFMLGLGESIEEVKTLIYDLKDAYVDILTIGQYLRPSDNNYPVHKYYTPEEFDEIREFADSLGFKYVVAGPYVRSSYQARDAFVASTS
ncbi:MAG: lipoyl synthase [Actinobacteria bacterium]|nr:lipoyl synthase [Actinomycetota bacterium]